MQLLTYSLWILIVSIFLFEQLHHDHLLSPKQQEMPLSQYLQLQKFNLNWFALILNQS